jgi:hypothetical protein
LPPALFQTWINTVNLALVTVPPLPRPPFNQFDWPLTPAPQQSAQSWTFSYNLNLIGRDRLPVGEILLALPPQQPTIAQTWINTVVSAAVTINPPTLFDTGTPPAAAQPDRGFVSSYNRNLIGQDRLPNRQQDWPLTPLAPQPDRGIAASYNKNLISQDRLPNRQTDWPLPNLGPQQPDIRTFGLFNINLYPPPTPTVPTLVLRTLTGVGL